MRLTKKELEIFRQCDGKHKTIDELFKCKSCKVLFENKKGELRK
jgi:hypothetical protein